MAKIRSLSVSLSVCKSPGFHFYIHQIHRVAPALLSDILAVGQAEAAGHGSGHHAGPPGHQPHPGDADYHRAEPGVHQLLHSEPGPQGRTDQASYILKESI